MKLKLSSVKEHWGVFATWSPSSAELVNVDCLILKQLKQLLCSLFSKKHLHQKGQINLLSGTDQDMVYNVTSEKTETQVPTIWFAVEMKDRFLANEKYMQPNRAL